ncbi:APC family permease [Pedobacter alluvionis]|uniref:APA family basic amino acid/polyamine antiporter n=1 Tax=Pedobacter alluvionis TaxID=475253 RepID=A0A497Y7G5_9SPHI|nr:APC family permease [Pedobacter alluvionis]RLJ76908.1 APA family basic amino acid/polyamine antiporter [Pedobacter alluvionis]TFB33832.1 APC family permease [Pedobacter alluvionis]
MQQKKQLSLFDLSMIVVSLVIGMGVFRTPVNVAAKAQIPELFYLAWFIGGFVAFCGALTYAEIGSRFPVTGGYYKIFSAAYHPSIAFAINCIVIISSAASVAAISIIGAEYLSKIILPVGKQTETYRVAIAIITILTFYFINLLGLKASSKTQNVLTVIKIGMILTLICAVFFGGQTETITPVFKTATGALPTWSDYGKALGLCLIAVSFSYAGYAQTINFGGEIKEAKKVIPRAIIIGLNIIVILYLAINYVYVKVIGFEELKSAESIAAILASKIFGPAGFKALSVIIFFSVMGYINVNLLSNPRAMFAMGEEGALPKIFSRMNKKTEVMTISLTVFTLIAVVIIFFAKTFDKILNYTIFLECISMASSAATIFILRKRTAHLDKKSIYTVPLYPILPIIFIAAYTFVAFSIYADDPNAALNGLYIFVGFLVVYFVSRWFNKK